MVGGAVGVARCASAQRRVLVVEEFDPAANRFVVRTEVHYTESQGDELQFYVGTFFHYLTLRDGELRLTLKRVNLLNCDAALPAVQLFI